MKRVFRRCLRFIIVIHFLILNVPGLASQLADDSAAYLRGKRAFSMYCQGCHTLRYADHTTLNTPTDEMVQWFGKLPPDLSNIARGRSNRWLNHFLDGFYPDAKRPFGSNNRQFPNVAMPNVLASIVDNKERAQTIHDIVNYLDATAEPNQVLRKKTGLKILIFLTCLVVYFWWTRRK